MKGRKVKKKKKKKKKEGKICRLINPGRIKSRPLDHAQYTSTAGGSGTRSTVGIKGLFRNLNQQSRSKKNETSHALMMRGVLPKH